MPPKAITVCVDVFALIECYPTSIKVAAPANGTSYALLPFAFQGVASFNISVAWCALGCVNMCLSTQPSGTSVSIFHTFHAAYPPSFLLITFFPTILFFCKSFFIFYIWAACLQVLDILFVFRGLSFVVSLHFIPCTCT